VNLLVVVIVKFHGHCLLTAEFDIILLSGVSRRKEMDWILISTLVMLSLLVPGTIYADEKIVIGGIEEVILLPWGVRLPARIDTGAAKSSLDARELKVQDDMVEFKLPKKHGDLQLRLPIIEWRHVRTPEGLEPRPIVELEICLGSKRIRTEVNLANRSMVKYPLILGRNFLREDYIVDVKRRKTAPPNCPKFLELDHR
jgi:hypothetical protein